VLPPFIKITLSIQKGVIQMTFQRGPSCKTFLHSNGFMETTFQEALLSKASL
jgi:hypothetical protein